MLSLLINPIKVLKNKIICEFENIKNCYSDRLAYQKSIYKKYNLSRSDGISIINKILKKQKYSDYDENSGMFSEHLIIFGSIASNEENNIKNILEIGTYDGISSSILVDLFPKAQLITVDLEDDNPTFKNIYNRNNASERNLFIKKRNARLSKLNNIKFVQMNSLNIPFNPVFKDKFDLIWVDGAHGYPIVCSDLTNAISLANKKAFIMCDDVWKSIKTSDPIYSSIAAWETLEAFRNAKIISCDYFYKRLGKKFLSSKKYISLSKLI